VKANNCKNKRDYDRDKEFVYLQKLLVQLPCSSVTSAITDGLYFPATGANLPVDKNPLKALPKTLAIIAAFYQMDMT